MNKSGTITKVTTNKGYYGSLYWAVTNVNTYNKTLTLSLKTILQRAEDNHNDFTSRIDNMKIQAGETVVDRGEYVVALNDSQFSSLNNRITIQAVEIPIPLTDGKIKTIIRSSFRCAGSELFESKIDAEIEIDGADITTAPVITNVTTTTTKTSAKFDIAIDNKGYDVGAIQYRNENDTDYALLGEDMTIDYLDIGTEYTVYIRVRNLFNGVFSEPYKVTFKTQGYDMSAPVNKSKVVRALTTSTIYAYSEWNEMVDGIKSIEISTDNGVTFKEIPQGQVEELLPGQTYQVVFRATGNNGVATVTPAVSVTTLSSDIEKMKITGTYKTGLQNVENI